MEIWGRLKRPTVQEVLDVVCEKVGLNGHVGCICSFRFLFYFSFPPTTTQTRSCFVNTILFH